MINFNDPNELMINIKLEYIDLTKIFVNSIDMRITMKQTGIIDFPELHILKEFEKI